MQYAMRQTLKLQEGLRTFAYDDATGLTLKPGDVLRGSLTIGVGHNLTAKGLPEYIISMILLEDITDVEILLRQLPWWRSLSPNRQDVVTNMAFNMGYANLLEFRGMITAIEQKDWDAAAKEMLASKWAKEVPSRAILLAAIMRTNQI